MPVLDDPKSDPPSQQPTHPKIAPKPLPPVEFGAGRRRLGAIPGPGPPKGPLNPRYPLRFIGFQAPKRPLGPGGPGILAESPAANPQADLRGAGGIHKSGNKRISNQHVDPGARIPRLALVVSLPASQPGYPADRANFVAGRPPFYRSLRQLFPRGGDRDK